ncbi:MAG: NAD(+) diphosphatase [Aquirhabdus sp.]
MAVNSSDQSIDESIISNIQIKGLLIHENSIFVDEKNHLPDLYAMEVNDLVVAETDGILYVTREVPQDYQLTGFTLTHLRHVLTKWSTAEFERASRAIQLLLWQRNHRFCSNCGEKTIRHANEFAMVCPACDYMQYPRLQPCVIVAITRHDEVNQPSILLARSPRFTIPMFSLIAGFVEVGETLEQAVAREVKEEVGIDVKNIRYMSSQPWPFPSNIMIGFHAEYAGGELVLQEDEILEAAFYPFDQLPLLPPTGSIANRMIEQIVGSGNI